MHRLTIIAAVAAAFTFATPAVAADPRAPDTTLSFKSADGKTTLTGYFWNAKRPGARPAVVLMHGCGGAYSSNATTFDAATVASQYREWGTRLSAAGYGVLLVDSFGPRGHGGGVCDIPYDERPAKLNEVTVRPLDAIGALQALRKQDRVLERPVALVGFSNGGSAVLSTVAKTGPAVWKKSAKKPSPWFAGAAAFYPGCGLQGEFDGAWEPTIPTHLFVGTADTTTPPAPECDDRYTEALERAAPVMMASFLGATHGFDRASAGTTTFAKAANAAAKTSALATMDTLLRSWLRKP
jgi:carboxymethylenebutenolidase